MIRNGISNIVKVSMIRNGISNIVKVLVYFELMILHLPC